MKIKIKFVLIPIAVITVLILSYAGFKAWWGDVHTVLYNVKSITAYDMVETDGYYEFRINATVKNWSDDFETKEYYLDGPDPLGSVDYSGMGVINPPKLKVTNKKSEFMLVFRLVPDDVNAETAKIDGREDVENCLFKLRFSAKNEDGMYVENAHSLFMNDFRYVNVKWADGSAE